jgi:hypothetical protein
MRSQKRTALLLALLASAAGPLAQAQQGRDSIALEAKISAIRAVYQDAPPIARVKSLAGCYVLTLGSWSGPLPKNDAPAAYTPPTRFRLDTLATRQGGHAVEPMNLVPSARPLTSWRPIASDSVRIVWSTGFGGVALQLRVVGDTLRGRATPFTDTPTGREPRASILAIRTGCAPAGQP